MRPPPYACATSPPPTFQTEHFPFFALNTPSSLLRFLRPPNLLHEPARELGEAFALLVQSLVQRGVRHVALRVELLVHGRDEDALGEDVGVSVGEDHLKL